jgi:hypothetical protein
MPCPPWGFWRLSKAAGTPNYAQVTLLANGITHPLHKNSLSFKVLYV